MIYVFREAASDGARQLADALNGRRARNEDRMRLRNGDFVIAWGEEYQPPAGVRVLNGAPIRNKFTDAEVLTRAGVPTIQVSRTRPTLRQAAPPADPAVAALRAFDELADDFAETAEDILRGANPTVPRTQPFLDGLNQLSQGLNALIQAARQPAPVAPPAQADGQWIGRQNNHTGGRDLLTPTQAPDYYARKEEFVAEYRIHTFLGRSIRAGKKDLRDGYSLNGANGTRTASSWVRSWDGGWRIKYDGESAKQKHRVLANQAVRALGLDFGAVDIGERADGSLVVLEVNRAPGIEGTTITAYVNAIQKWQSGEWTYREPAAPQTKAQRTGEVRAARRRAA